jgi:hypothetical protein
MSHFSGPNITRFGGNHLRVFCSHLCCRSVDSCVGADRPLIAIFHIYFCVIFAFAGPPRPRRAALVALTRTTRPSSALSNECERGRRRLAALCVVLVSPSSFSTALSLGARSGDMEPMGTLRPNPTLCVFPRYDCGLRFLLFLVSNISNI